MIMKITQDGEVRSVETEKVKDGEKAAILAYRLKVVDLGPDEDGDPITTCVVDVVGKPKARRRRPTRQAQKALAELEELLIDGKGEPSDGHLGHPLESSLSGKTTGGQPASQGSLVLRGMQEPSRGRSTALTRRWRRPAG